MLTYLLQLVIRVSAYFVVRHIVCFLVIQSLGSDDLGMLQCHLRLMTRYLQGQLLQVCKVELANLLVHYYDPRQNALRVRILHYILRPN